MTIVGATLGLALAGAGLAVNIVQTGDDSAHAHPAYVTGDTVPTTFGQLSITQVDVLAGLSADDVGGVTHGVANLVPPDKEQVQLSMVLTNAGDSGVDYSLDKQFNLVTSSGGEVTAMPGISAPRGRLSGHSSMTMQLRYMAPRDGGDLILEYRDPGARRLVRVGVGSTDLTPVGALNGYHDHDPKSASQP
jgi:hypothetical protein